MTRIVLVRHAEAQGNVTRVFHGWTDSSLTEKGIRQARRLAERMKDENIDCIYSSDLKRAYDTANFIADIKDLDVFIDKKLREINGGDWENISFDDLIKTWPEELFNLNNCLYNLSAPNGENVLDFYARIVSSIERIISENENKNICIVTHGTAIKLILCYFYSRPIEEVETIMWSDNTAVSYITFDNNKYNVVVESDNSHLDDELSTLLTQNWWKK